MTTSIVTMLVVPFRLFRWIKKVTPAHLLHAMKFRQHLDPTSIHHVRMFEQYEPPRLFCCQISAVKARFCSFNSFFFPWCGDLFCEPLSFLYHYIESVGGWLAFYCLWCDFCLTWQTLFFVNIRPLFFLRLLSYFDKSCLFWQDLYRAFCL